MAVVVGNRKQLTPLLLLCMITSAIIPPWAEAQPSCYEVREQLRPCSDFVAGGGSIPAECCEALKTLADSLRTTVDRQTACECLKASVSRFSPDQQKRAKILPDYCQAPLPFNLDKNFDCSSVPKRNF